MPVGELVAGRFRLDVLMRVGGMGAVWRAFDADTQRPVALKLLTGAGEALERRFLREAHLLAEIDHPQVVRHVAHGAAGDGRLYLAMEWLDGEDLADHLRRGPLDPTDALVMIAGAARALALLHARGGVHRDVKPSNLFLVGGEVGCVKLLDFGIARLGALARITASGELAGTPGYAAPEQARGERRIDARADVFALGCVLFEALTGRPAFTGDHVMAILAKILLADPPRVIDLVPQVPPAIEGLVARLIDKDPARRPADAAVVLAEVEALLAAGPLSLSGARPTPRPPALGVAEQRFMSLVLCEGTRRGGASATRLAELPTAAGVITPVRATTPSAPGLDDTLAPPAEATPELVRALARAQGGRLEVLADGTWVVAPLGPLLRLPAADQAVQVARIALALHRLLPEARFAVASGRGVQAGRVPVGEVIDRAAALLGQGGPGSIRVDTLTADLLGGRFSLSGERGAIRLGGERLDPEPERRLLGVATACVGRERELGTLIGLGEECASEPVARAVLVVAPAGFGKSRLMTEASARLAARGLAFRTLAVRGEPLQAGAPLSLAARLLRRAAGLDLGQELGERSRRLAELIARVVPPGDVARVATFLGQLADVPVAEPVAELEAARRDPLVMGEQVRRAFEDWIAGECRVAPVMLVLDDLHLGDLSSIRLIDALLRRLKAAPLLVVALARPEIDDVFPALLADRELQRVPLRELPRKACEKLVREVLPQADLATVTRLSEHSAGNVFYLEELIRVVAEGGSSDWPTSVVAMAQARLDGLDPDERRLLRAGAVFGDRFPLAGVRVLFGDSGPARVDALVAGLCEQELLIAEPEAPGGEPGFQFRHALVREAAYAMFTESDRALGHRLAAEWLETVGERDPALLAEHWQRGGDSERAAAAWLGAARVALGASDLVAVLRAVDRGLGAGARGEALGELLWLRAEAHRWRADLSASAETAALALAALPAGHPVWYDAVATLGSGLNSLQQYDRLEELVQRLVAAPCAPGAEIPRASALARITVQLYLIGRYALAEELTARMEREASGAVAAPGLMRGGVLEARAFRAGARAQQGVCLGLLSDALAAYQRAGDLRHACMTQSNLGYTWLQIGAYERAVTELERAIVDAERLGLAFVAMVAQQNLGLALMHVGEHGRAAATERESMAALRKRGDLHMAAICRVYLAQILLAGGDAQAAEIEASAAIEALVESPPAHALSLATLAQIRLALGAAPSALAAARQAHGILAELGGLDEGELLVRAVFIAALAASGRSDEASAVAEVAVRRLHELAATLDDPQLRAQFLTRVPEHSAIVAAANFGEAR
jgi:tetratricopeptide (TPR) repeat protein